MLNIIIGKIRIANVLERAVLESEKYIVLYNASKDRYDMYLQKDGEKLHIIAFGGYGEVVGTFKQFTSIATVRDAKSAMIAELKEHSFAIEVIDDSRFVASNASIAVEVSEHVAENIHSLKTRIAPVGCYWQPLENASVESILSYNYPLLGN